MDQDQELVVVIYTENHRDRQQTFIGIFSSRDKAAEAAEKHRAREQARLPGARISKADYFYYHCQLDEVC